MSARYYVDLDGYPVQRKKNSVYDWLHVLATGIWLAVCGGYLVTLFLRLTIGL